MVNKIMKMAELIKDTTRMTRSMAMAFIHGLMGKFTTVPGERANNTVKPNSPTLLAKAR